MQDRLESKKRNNHINFMTFNIACLPFSGAINGAFLKSNHERVQQITDRIIQWNTDSKNSDTAPDIICFQEALAIESRYQLKQKLLSYYPFDTEKLGQRLRGSGLFLFSKYPILDSHYEQFSNVVTASERLAIKGFIGAKIAIDDNHFITVYDTHLESGGDIESERQNELYGTASWRRGEQMGRIYHDMQTWSTEPPSSNPTMQHIKTFLLGDLNAPLNDERRMYSISTGKSNNGYKKGMKKYPGQYDLFTLLEHTVPSNFLDIRDESKETKGRKVIVPELLEKAKKENYFIGSYIPKEITKENKKNNTFAKPYQANPRVIDGVFCSKTAHTTHQPPEFESMILPHHFNGETGTSNINLSDHFPVWARWRNSFFTKQDAPSTIDKPNTRNVNKCTII